MESWGFGPGAHYGSTRDRHLIHSVGRLEYYLAAVFRPLVGKPDGAIEEVGPVGETRPAGKLGGVRAGGDGRRDVAFAARSELG